MPRIKLEFEYRPPAKLVRSSAVERAPVKREVLGSKPSEPAKPKKGRPKSGFDKKEYQRRYMRDKTQADKEGLTVKEWRDKYGKSA